MITYDDQIAWVKRELDKTWYKQDSTTETQTIQAILRTVQIAAKLEPTLTEIHKCVVNNRQNCAHCDSIVKVVEDVLTLVG